MFLVLFLAVPSQLVRLVPILQRETKSNQPTDVDRLKTNGPIPDPCRCSLCFFQRQIPSCQKPYESCSNKKQKQVLCKARSIKKKEVGGQG